MTGLDRLSTPINEQLVNARGRPENVTLDLALALGLVRVLTRLPVFDESLAEVEGRLAGAVEAVGDVRDCLLECAVLVARSALIPVDLDGDV